MAAAPLHIGEEEADNTYTCWLCLSCGCKKIKKYQGGGEVLVLLEEPPAAS